MFENIIGHDGIKSLLKGEIEDNRLPRSLLFYGAPLGGKLTTAFELARILSCRNDGQWSCSCPSCRSHRLLESTNTVFLGSRDFEEEISVCADVLADNPVKAVRYLFYRSVRKLSRQFDENLWKGQEQLLRKILPELEKINESLEIISPENDVPGKTVVSLSKRIMESCRRIGNTIRTDGISVNRIRNMAYWTHTTADSGSKIVIIDGADGMGDGASNAMLKILEEPPENVFFILVSETREGIMPTILSRVRPYYFPERSTEVQAVVIERIFRNKGSSYGSLKDFFLLKNGIDRGLLRKYALSIAGLFAGEEKPDVRGMDDIVEYISGEKNFIPFAEEFTDVLRDILSGKSVLKKEVSVHDVSLWYNRLKEIVENRKSYNQNASLLLSSFIYELGMLKGNSNR